VDYAILVRVDIDGSILPPGEFICVNLYNNVLVEDVTCKIKLGVPQILIPDVPV
jgi:hypothetical protein